MVIVWGLVGALAVHFAWTDFHAFYHVALPPLLWTVIFLLWDIYKILYR